MKTKNRAGRSFADAKPSKASNRTFHRSLIVMALIGLLLRVLLMPFGSNVDFRFTNDIAAFIEAAMEWTSPGDSDRTSFYPPLAYYTFSAYIVHLVRPLLHDLLTVPIRGLEATSRWFSSSEVFRTLFVLKAWYLPVDLGIALFLWQLWKHEPTKARKALLAWVFSPLVLFTAYFHGQFDLVPVLFVVLSLFFAWKERPFWAAFWMGVSACYKNYAFFFLLPLVLVLDRSWLGRLRSLLSGTLLYILLLALNLQDYASMDRHYSDMFFSVGYDLGHGARIYAFFAIYAFTIWYIYQARSHTVADLWRACFAILLVYYQFSLFELHYWVWIVPFAIIYWVEHPEEAKPFYLVIGLCLLILTANRPLGRYLAPISPRFFLRLPSLLEVLNPYLPMTFLLNIVRSLLAGTSFYLAWKLVRGIGKPDASPPRPIAVEGSHSQ